MSSLKTNSFLTFAVCRQNHKLGKQNSFLDIPSPKTNSKIFKPRQTRRIAFSKKNRELKNHLCFSNKAPSIVDDSDDFSVASLKDLMQGQYSESNLNNFSRFDQVFDLPTSEKGSELGFGEMDNQTAVFNNDLRTIFHSFACGRATTN